MVGTKYKMGRDAMNHRVPGGKLTLFAGGGGALDSVRYCRTLDRSFGIKTKFFSRRNVGIKNIKWGGNRSR
jgi:hypothetical protein